MRKKNIKYEDFKAELLSDNEVRAEFEALEPQFRLIRSILSRRNELNLSQTQLAKLIGMQQPAISRLENGGHNTTISTLFKVADALALDVELKPRALPKAQPHTKVKSR